MAEYLDGVLLEYNYSKKSDVIVKFFVNTFIYIIDNETLSKNIKNSFKRLNKYFKSSILLKYIKDVDSNIFNKNERKIYLIIRFRLYNLYFIYSKFRKHRF